MSSPVPHSSSSTAASLGPVVDEHLRWLTRWHRAVFFHAESGLPGVEAVTPPTAFLDWVRRIRDTELTEQPAVDRLVHLHEQLHRMARLMLARTIEGDRLTLPAYESVVEKFEDFIAQCRRFEKAFSIAGSGIDPLTGLRNRTGMHEELERELNRFRRMGRPFCVALCDLDKFKSVNDTYGHEAGDRVLMAAAGAINRGIRSFDEAFRMGGEEILILLKDTTAPEALFVLERLRADLEALPVQLADGGTLHVTASFGLAEATLHTPLEELVDQADQALYRAKRTGRNRVVCHGEADLVAADAG
ncbi:diguanylate cyclase [Indioceanicola profundi]|uniref:diguanylate cyclase n=1 Tax=Indioceanicola profundi TaxID=2220096 RepID=UPI000E6ADE0B|nr:diguanylate cyclase [Indioceanicola profundi]